MRKCLFSVLVVITVLASVSGCVTSSDSADSTDRSFNLGPMLGLIGMIVDGDDKDDYEHLLHGDDCHCGCH